MADPKEKPQASGPSELPKDSGLKDNEMKYFKNRVSALSPELKSILEQISQASNALQLSYQKAHDDAAAGKFVTADSFNVPEQKYNDAIKRLEQQADQEIDREVAKKMKDEKPAAPVPDKDETFTQAIKRNLLQEVADTGKALQLKDQMHMDFLLGEAGAHLRDTFNSDETHKAIRDEAPLNDAFRREYIAAATHRKDDTLAPGTRTASELLTDLLSKNPGIAIGDVHTHDNAPKLIVDNLDALKKAGVDTIYIEFPSDTMQKINRLSPKELEQLAADGHFADIRGSDAKERAEIYGVNHADADGWIPMIAKAKLQGIRVINIDKKDAARDDEVSLSVAHRVASDNFIWTENIQNDRRHLAATGKGGGKYVVFGGADHFLKDTDTQGMVADALGIPVVNFERSDPNATIPFRRVLSMNAADFSLPGGKDYLDTADKARMLDIRDIDSALGHVEFIPGVPELSKTLKNLADQYNDAYIKSIDMRKRVSLDAGDDKVGKEPLSTAPAQIPKAPISKEPPHNDAKPGPTIKDGKDVPPERQMHIVPQPTPAGMSAISMNGIGSY